MAKKKKTESLSPLRGQEADSPHAALKLRHRLQGHTSSVYRMALSPNGRILASPSSDKSVRLWNVESGRGLKTLEYPDSTVSVGWSIDGTMLATGGGYQNMKVYLSDTTTGRQTRILEGHGDAVKGVVWSPDGKILASCSDDSTIRLWDTASGRLLRALKGHSNVEGVAWSPDSRWLCSGLWDKTINLWNPKNGEKSA